jgi:hypothetical protein
MSVWRAGEREFARSVSNSVFLNPFRAHEFAQRLGVAQQLATSDSWNAAGITADVEFAVRPEIEPILKRALQILSEIRQRQFETNVTDDDFRLY